MGAGSYERKEFVGGAPATTITGSITDAATSFDIDDATGWPTATTYPFVCVIDRGAATEEKILVGARSTVTLSSITRGYDNTTEQAHSSGSTIEHAIDASTVDQVNRLANLFTDKGDVYAFDGTNVVAVSGATMDGSEDGYVLEVSQAEATGLIFARPVHVEVNASAPTVDAVPRIWHDTTSDLIRISDGATWVIPSTLPQVADATARNTLVGATPSNGTFVYRADYNFIEGYVEAAWRPFSTPVFASTTVRDAYYTSPADGDKARTSDTYSEWEYRQDEWIRTNQKITQSGTQPASPHAGDIWLQPVT
jgi:hypothetical protein